VGEGQGNADGMCSSTCHLCEFISNWNLLSHARQANVPIRVHATIWGEQTFGLCLARDPCPSSQIVMCLTYRFCQVLADRSVRNKISLRPRQRQVEWCELSGALCRVCVDCAKSEVSKPSPLPLDAFVVTCRGRCWCTQPEPFFLQINRTNANGEWLTQCPVSSAHIFQLRLAVAFEASVSTSRLRIPFAHVTSTSIKYHQFLGVLNNHYALFPEHHAQLTIQDTFPNNSSHIGHSRLRRRPLRPRRGILSSRQVNISFLPSHFALGN